MEYPKIPTLYTRNRLRKVNVNELSRPELALINSFQVTEKLNGRNIRVLLSTAGEVSFAGRQDEKNLSDQIDRKMLDYLRSVFTPEKMKAVFWRTNKQGVYETPEVCLYLEGLGSVMAAGSGIYCPGTSVSVRVIDCYIKPWWIERLLLEKFASELGVKCAPLLGTIYTFPKSLSDLENIIKTSSVATEDNNNFVRAEGIVARTYPLLFNRRGERVMWKLKFKDF